MRYSDSIKALAPALLAVQRELEPVGKDSTNPHFKNRYASLIKITEYVVEILNKHGLVLLQGGDGGMEATGIETVILHAASGEFISTSVVMPIDARNTNPQGAGSAITYGRRYGLSALLALTTEDDDDGEGASSFTRQIPSVAAQTGHKASALSGPPPAGCPACGGDMWDNRLTKTNPKQPDFKCKDAECGKAVWLQSKAAAATKSTAGKVVDAFDDERDEFGNFI